MKKTLLILATLMVMSGSIFAQGFDFSIGPKVGYQATKLSYKKADIKDGFANHFTIGAFARLDFGRLYLQPELLYFKSSNLFSYDFSTMGEGIPSGANLNVTLNNMNLQLPILVGLDIIDSDILGLRIQAGPTANFVLQSKTLVDYSIGGQQSDPEEQKEGFDTKSIAWGFQAGIGVDVLKNITLDINYNFGLSKVFNKIGEQEIGGYQLNFNNIDDSKVNTFMVTVGYKFL